MKPTSPETLALAGLGAALLDFALAAIVVFAGVDRFAPPQDLPWKPFSLSQPIGLATSAKLTRLTDDPAACRAALSEGGLTFRDAPVREQGFCSTADTLRLSSGASLAPAGPLMTCGLALTYALWERQVAAPAAQIAFDQPLARVEHYGTYSCRTVYGREGGRPSNHATANALDVSGFRMRDGRRVTIASDFRDPGPEGRFLRAVRDGACRLFGSTLSPDYNAAHADHLHLDRSRYRICR
ncbi:extensin-like domain-containing protein [Caulobacter sp. NIBR2454]|uniref:extensin-like domain-containing protein n=1 Tax=Caulobacter sp. NIBR2454 TaxID=3015996 RepID=UPI0022B5F0F3|nr:extensin family protein [Caulobacter sp. NIBR2454]